MDMPARLAECAFDLFARRGIDRVKMDDIAARAGVTKGSLYWHYESKREVIAAACRHYYRQWHRQMERELEGLRSPASKLRQAVESSVRTCLIDKSNRTFTLELFTLSLHDVAVRGGWREFFDGVKTFYIDLLTAAQSGDEIGDRDPGETVDLMLAAMEGYKLRALFEPELCAPKAERRIARDLLGILGVEALSS